jgi:hypothetical protein
MAGIGRGGKARPAGQAGRVWGLGNEVEWRAGGMLSLRAHRDSLPVTHLSWHGS